MLVNKCIEKKRLEKCDILYLGAPFVEQNRIPIRTVKAVFHFNCIVVKRNVIISLFLEHSGRTNNMDTIEYATFRNGTVEVENGL